MKGQTDAAKQPRVQRKRLIISKYGPLHAVTKGSTILRANQSAKSRLQAKFTCLHSTCPRYSRGISMVRFCTDEASFYLRAVILRVVVTVAGIKWRRLRLELELLKLDDGATDFARSR